jgi:hypothetical protein
MGDGADEATDFRYDAETMMVKTSDDEVSLEEMAELSLERTTERVRRLSDDFSPGAIVEDFDVEITDTMSEEVREQFNEMDIPIATAIRNTASQMEELHGRRLSAEMLCDDEGIHEIPGHGHDSVHYETVEYTVSIQMAKALMEEIADRIEERERAGFQPTTLVLGVKQYEKLLPWTQREYGQPPETVLAVDDVIVVPPPMIYVVVPPTRALQEHTDG